jgi:hypothetical protein
MNPNVLFILYWLVAIPIFLTSKRLEASFYSVGQMIGYSLIPLIFVVIYNFKKNNKPLRIIASIITISWILITVIGTLETLHSTGEPKIKYSETITFPGCEFQVHFPIKTKQKTIYANGIESLMVQNIYDGEGLFMRAECLPLVDPSQTIAAFRTVLEGQAKMAGIQNPEITIEQTKLGMAGTYSGLRKAGGIELKLFGKLIIGRQSLLSLFTSDDLAKFPSDKVVYFLNTVERK